MGFHFYLIDTDGTYVRCSILSWRKLVNRRDSFPYCMVKPGNSDWLYISTRDSHYLPRVHCNLLCYIMNLPPTDAHNALGSRAAFHVVLADLRISDVPDNDSLGPATPLSFFPSRFPSSNFYLDSGIGRPPSESQHGVVESQYSRYLFTLTAECGEGAHE